MLTSITHSSPINWNQDVQSLQSNQTASLEQVYDAAQKVLHEAEKMAYEGPVDRPLICRVSFEQKPEPVSPSRIKALLGMLISSPAPASLEGRVSFGPKLEMILTCSPCEVNRVDQAIKRIFASSHLKSLIQRGELKTALKKARHIFAEEEFRFRIDRGHHLPNLSPTQFSPIKINDLHYIATSHPRFSTEAFWETIYNNNVGLFIKLAGDPYWSNTVEEFSESGLKLELSQEEKISPVMTERKFILQKGNRGRVITQIEFSAWPDFGVPKVEDFHALLKRINDLGSKTPMLVHCGAGIGRTGTLIAAHSQLTLDEPRFLETVLSLRAQRKAPMVETVEQYCMLYRIHEYFLERKAAIN